MMPVPPLTQGGYFKISTAPHLPAAMNGKSG
jgi:hypothetical protein